MDHSEHRSTNGNPAADFLSPSCNLLSNTSAESSVKFRDALCQYSLQTPLSKRSYRLLSSIRPERCITTRSLQTATLPSQGVSCSTYRSHTRYTNQDGTITIRKGLKREVQLVPMSSRQQFHFKQVSKIEGFYLFFFFFRRII